MKNQQAPWSHASSPMPPCASKEQGIRARKAVVPKRVGSEDDDEDNVAETAFDGYKKQSIGCCLVPAMGCSTRRTTFILPSESFATPGWPQGGDSQGALAGWLVFITEMKPVRRLCSASPAPHYRVRLCLSDHWMWLHLEMGALKSKWWTWMEVTRPGPDPHMTGVLKRREFRHTGGCTQRRDPRGVHREGPGKDTQRRGLSTSRGVASGEPKVLKPWSWLLGPQVSFGCVSHMSTGFYYGSPRKLMQCVEGIIYVGIGSGRWNSNYPGILNIFILWKPSFQIFMSWLNAN